MVNQVNIYIYKLYYLSQPDSYLIIKFKKMKSFSFLYNLVTDKFMYLHKCLFLDAFSITFVLITF